MKKLLVSTQTLLTALQTAVKTAEKKSILPILENFLFTVCAGPNGAKLTIAATDLQNTISVSFPCEAIESFSFVVPVTELKLVEKIEADTVTFTASEKIVKAKKAGDKDSIIFIVKIDASEDKVNLQSENPLDFPSMPVFDYGKQLAAWVNNDFQSELKTLLNYVSKDDTRPAMTGVFFETLENGYNLTATDAHLLKHITLKAETLYNGELSEDNKVNAILPAKFCKLIAGFAKVSEMLIAKQDLNFFAQFTLNEIYNVVISTRAIDANFPNYTAVIPQANPINVKAEIEPMLKLMSKAALYANKTTWQGQFSINGDIKIGATDIDFNKEYSGRMPHIQHSGADIEIGFNLMFMQKALKDVKGKTFDLELSTPTRAGVIRESNGLTLVMPVMINA